MSSCLETLALRRSGQLEASAAGGCPAEKTSPLERCWEQSTDDQRRLRISGKERMEPGDLLWAVRAVVHHRVALALDTWNASYVLPVHSELLLRRFLQPCKLKAYGDTWRKTESLP
jgi:hypothetical protein